MRVTFSFTFDSVTVILVSASPLILFDVENIYFDDNWKDFSANITNCLPGLLICTQASLATRRKNIPAGMRMKL